MKSKVSKRSQSNGHSRVKLPTAWTSKKHKVDISKLFDSESKDLSDYAEALIEAAPSLLVLDQDLRVKAANESFFKCFKINSREALNRPVFELGNGQWNIAALRMLLKEVLPKKKLFRNFEVTHKFESIGTRTMLVSGKQVDHLQCILVFIDDITERREAQAAVGTSEIRYRRLFEAARDGILVLDPETRKITDANPFMSELLGYPAKELVGKELWEIGLLKDEKASRSAFRELRRKHFIRYEDLPLQNKLGQRREVEFVSNLYDEGGHQVIQCNIRDITERKQAESALKASEERLKILFDLGPVAIYSCDTSGLIRDFNRRAAELWGRTPKKRDTDQRFCGSFKMFLPNGTFLPHDQCPMAQVLTGRIPSVKDAEVRLERPDGSTITVLANIVPLKNERGRITGAINCFADITERKLAEATLLAARNAIDKHTLNLEQVVADRTAELQETIGELEGFSYSVSHDMRAPLRAMQSYASYLVEEYTGKLDATGVEYLQKIMRSSVRLDRLIQDVLSYTRLIHAKVPISSVDLDRLVRDMVDVLPNGQPIKPKITIKGTLPPVMGNEALLAQCVSNLLANGAKFVSPGTAPRLVVSAKQTRDSSIRLSFRDNGIGIAPENHERIFRLFERIYPDTEYEGTGIGLTIVRKAADRMNAEIGFESQLGKGSNFWIQLKKG